MKNLIIWTLIVTAGVFGTGCTAEEVGAGAIGVGIGIGIGRGDHWDRDHRDGRRHRRPPRHHRPRCDRWGCWGDMNAQANNSAEVSRLASKYQIPVTSATKITQAFANAESQGLSAFRAMGLADKDFKAMMNYEMPSDAAVKNASDKLDLSQQQGRQLLVAMMKEFRSQASDVNSEYWAYCTSAGKWKTDRNSSCANTNWPGCSPQTGAKFCY